MPSSPPRIAYEERGPHHAVIWYERPRSPRPATGDGSGRKPATVAATLPRVVLAVPSWDRPCGVAEYSKGLRRGLQALGVETVVARDGDDLVRLARELAAGVVHVQHEYSLWDPFALRRQAMALLRAGVRTVATVHALAPVPEHNAVLADCFQALVVHAPAMRSEACAVLQVPAQRVHVIPMGARTWEEGDRAALRARLGLDGAPAIGFVGFFYPQKGILELVRAARELRRTLPGLRCLIFASVAANEGSRRYREEVASRLAAEGLLGEAEFHEGFLPEGELVQRLAALDAIVLPYAEYPARQLSAAVRTAISACRPIVVTDVFAFSDLDGEVYRIPGNAPEQIAGGVRAVLGDEGRQAALVAACRRYLEGNSWERVAARHLDLYRW